MEDTRASQAFQGGETTATPPAAAAEAEPATTSTSEPLQITTTDRSTTIVAASINSLYPDERAPVESAALEGLAPLTDGETGHSRQREVGIPLRVVSGRPAPLSWSAEQNAAAIEHPKAGGSCLGVAPSWCLKHAGGCNHGRDLCRCAGCKFQGFGTPGALVSGVWRGSSER
mmetsp:Transcript_43105/g.103984  ORF Transcript_43105/g.103984 Transcript_43105/m.103984 type:complete len:172 (-) Transcript_43105:179-694(-)